MKNKSLLILGAGFGQLPAIRKAKELGIKTICVDKNPSAIGMREADYSYVIDVIDFEGCLEISKKHNISGVMTMQSDISVPTIGYINDKLFLKGVSLEVANACSNKVLTRKKLAAKFCNQPQFSIVKSIEEVHETVKKIGFPCVIKAPDSSGSRGVIKVHEHGEIDHAFKEALSYSRGTEIIVEEYISGLEFGAQTFSVNGDCEIVLLHNDTMSPPPHMIPIGHSFPFNKLDDTTTKKAVNDIKKAINALGITDGPANVDLILDEKCNEIKIIEIGARIGATCLPELVEYNIGKSWVELTILNIIGESIDTTITQNNSVAAIIIESPKNGIYKGFTMKEPRSKLILEFEITANIGDKVSILKKGTDRIGKIVVSGNNPIEAEKHALELRNELIIHVD